MQITISIDPQDFKWISRVRNLRAKLPSDDTLLSVIEKQEEYFEMEARIAIENYIANAIGQSIWQTPDSYAFPPDGDN